MNNTQRKLLKFLEKNDNGYTTKQIFKSVVFRDSKYNTIAKNLWLLEIEGYVDKKRVLRSVVYKINRRGLDWTRGNS